MSASLLRYEGGIVDKSLIDKSKRSYIHFDKRRSLELRSVREYVEDKEKIAKHAFYPFIAFDKDYTKYLGDKNKKPKVRLLSYSSHMDRCIFQYYSYLINKAYDGRVKRDGIDECSIAYRSNLHLSNIELSKRAFDFIKKDSCYVVIGDFTGFFDNLSHNYLKQRIIDVMGFKDRLPPDFYAVYKNITKYSYCYIEDVMDFLGLKYTFKNRKKLNKKDKLLSTDEWKEFKKKRFAYRRKEKNKQEKCRDEQFHKAIMQNADYTRTDKMKYSKGIPQGSAISAVLANVYMLEFDKILHEYTKSLSGLYMRYSDDFILIIPKKNCSLDDVKLKINTCKQMIEGIELEKEKTKTYQYKENKIERIDENGGIHPNDFIDYLGFSFDGNKVKIRNKTITKYYYRLKKKIKGSINLSKFKKRRELRSIYRLYSDHRSSRYYILQRKKKQNRISDSEKAELKKLEKGNFFDYMKHCQRVFGNEIDIDDDMRKEKAKIKKEIKNKIKKQEKILDVTY